MNYSYVIFTLDKLMNFTDKLADEMNVTSVSFLIQVEELKVY